jgi:hypothetical protein
MFSFSVGLSGQSKHRQEEEALVKFAGLRVQTCISSWVKSNQLHICIVHVIFLHPLLILFHFISL